MTLTFGFQIEHDVAEKALTPANMAFLQGIGFAVDMRGNRTMLFQDQGTVANIQAAPQSFKDMLIGAGSGIIRHDSTDLPAGFQKGKNEFFNAQLDIIREDGISDDAKKYAAFELIEWTKQLTAGGLPGAE